MLTKITDTHDALHNATYAARYLAMAFASPNPALWNSLALSHMRKAAEAMGLSIVERHLPGDVHAAAYAHETSLNRGHANDEAEWNR